MDKHYLIIDNDKTPNEFVFDGLNAIRAVVHDLDALAVAFHRVGNTKLAAGLDDHCNIIKRACTEIQHGTVLALQHQTNNGAALLKSIGSMAESVLSPDRFK